jgi:hypothetical protein
MSTQLLVTLDVSNDRVEIFKFPVLRTTETLNVVSNYNLQQFTLPALTTAEVRFGPFLFVLFWLCRCAAFCRFEKS